MLFLSGTSYLEISFPFSSVITDKIVNKNLSHISHARCNELGPPWPGPAHLTLTARTLVFQFDGLAHKTQGDDAYQPLKFVHVGSPPSNLQFPVTLPSPPAPRQQPFLAGPLTSPTKAVAVSSLRTLPLYIFTRKSFKISTVKYSPSFSFKISVEIESLRRPQKEKE